MIQIIHDEAQFDINMLNKSLNGKRIISYYKAYGLNYNFCRFYKLNYDDGTGIMFMFNSTLLICSSDDLPPDEIAEFIRMHMPFRVEGSQNIIRKFTEIEGYRPLNRNVFEMTADTDDVNRQFVEMNPNLNQVYDILCECFPNLTGFDLWYADTSHRIRHNVSRVFIYKGCTTAGIMYDIDDIILIGQVATKIASRGRGHATDFLKWLTSYLTKAGKRAYLLALDSKYDYYKHIGFKDIDKEIVLERITNEPKN